MTGESPDWVNKGLTPYNYPLSAGFNLPFLQHLNYNSRFFLCDLFFSKQQ